MEGPPEEVKEACRKLKEMTDNLKTQVAYEEVKIKPAFHRHIIGKNGANSKIFSVSYFKIFLLHI